MSRLRYKTLFASLLQSVPEYEADYEEDLAYYGEVIPHVFFADFMRFALRAVLRGDQDVVKRSLDFVERALGTDDEDVVNIAAVSFVENLFGEIGCRQLLAVGGPLLRAEYNYQYGKEAEP